MRAALPLMEIEGLCFDYPSMRALDHVSLALMPRSITALVGPNGAGKTTLLRCLAVLEPAHEGRVLFDGIDVAQDPRTAHRHIGYLPDNFGLYAELTARQCLEYAARSHGLHDAEIPQRVSDCAARVGLDDRLEQRAGHLSRGQRQRLALAQAIVHSPRLLLLDEPASGLDPEARASLASLLRDLAGDGMTLVVSSHILAELESYCTAMLVLSAGRVVDHKLTQSATNPAQFGRRVRIRLALGALPATWPNALRNIEVEGDTVFAHVEGDDVRLHALLGELLAAGLPVCEFGIVADSLQSTYLTALREARA